MTGKKIFITLAAFSLAACTMTPEYTRPTAPVPKNWPAGAAYQETKSTTPAQAGSELPWREIFIDENMQKIIETALNNNRDLRLAALNVERGAGTLRHSAVPSCCRQSMQSGWGVNNWSRLIFRPPESAMTAEQYSVNLGITSWEIDFFGRIRSLKDQALEEYLATDQARRSAQILLVSAVAQAYLTLAADRENLKLAASTLETQEASYKLIRKRQNVGLASELDLRRAQSQVETARGDVARYTQLTAQDENALNLLVGSPTAAVSSCLRIWPASALLKRFLPACPPNCSCAGRMYWRRNIGSRRPMPISAPPVLLSFPASP